MLLLLRPASTGTTDITDSDTGSALDAEASRDIALQETASGAETDSLQAVLTAIETAGAVEVIFSRSFGQSDSGSGEDDQTLDTGQPPQLDAIPIHAAVVGKGHQELPMFRQSGNARVSDDEQVLVLL